MMMMLMKIRWERSAHIPGVLTISHFLILIFYTPVAANVLALPIQSPTRIPEKIVVALFSGVLVNSGIQVEAGRHIVSK